MKIGDHTRLPDGRWGTITTMRGAAHNGQRWCGVRLDEGGYVSLYLEAGDETDRLMVTDISVGQAFDLAQLVIGGATVAMPVQSQVLLLARALITVGRPS